FTSRAPEVNELYSNGLHQGVSGIEQGNPELNQEYSLKSVMSNNWNISDKVFIQSVLYYQLIKDFIFLQPNEEFVLTIRGAFPLFTYEQTNARIYGTDLQISVEPFPQLKIINSLSLVRGTDTRLNTPLVYIPADQYKGELKYALRNGRIFKDKTIAFNWQYTFEQSRYNPDLDFLQPPSAYFLLGARIGATLPIGENNLDFSLMVNNLLNVKYRDYLNRLRYYADDQGRNIILRLNYRFKT
ncbi:MAG: TonB-dependent receptor, partial [Saprospiraceae bacterium]|nr:TonB-dependent receptor [Saprospiraceae bacterium]